MSSKQENQPGRLRFTALSIVLHVLLIGLIVLGLEFSDYHPVSGPQVKIIQAVVMPNSATPATEKPSKVEKQDEDEFVRKAEEAERKRQEELAQKREQEQKLEQKRLQEEARRKQELEQKREAAAKQKAELAARQKANEAAKLKTQADADKKAEEQAQLKKQEENRQKAAAEAEARRQAEEDKKKQAEERKRLQAAEEAKKAAEEKAKREATDKAIREARQHEMEQALAEEQRQRDAAAAAARNKELNSLIAAYSAAIKRRVQSNWAIPSSAPPDYTCKVRVTQDKSGHVTGVKITSSCGSAVLDDSLYRAILKSDPLPQAPDPDVFDSDLELCFSPNPANCS